jgi:hypothetical protein
MPMESLNPVLSCAFHSSFPSYLPMSTAPWIQLCAALKVAVQGEDRSADRGIHADGGPLIPAYQGG